VCELHLGGWQSQVTLCVRAPQPARIWVLGGICILIGYKLRCCSENDTAERAEGLGQMRWGCVLQSANNRQATRRGDNGPQEILSLSQLLVDIQPEPSESSLIKLPLKDWQEKSGFASPSPSSPRAAQSNWNLRAILWAGGMEGGLRQTAICVTVNFQPGTQAKQIYPAASACYKCADTTCEQNLRWLKHPKDHFAHHQPDQLGRGGGRVINAVVKT